MQPDNVHAADVVPLRPGDIVESDTVDRINLRLVAIKRQIAEIKGLQAEQLRLLRGWD